MSGGSFYQDMENLMEIWTGHKNRSISSLGYSRTSTVGSKIRFAAVDAIARMVNSLLSAVGGGSAINIGPVGVALNLALDSMDTTNNNIQTIDTNVQSIVDQYENIKNVITNSKEDIESNTPEQTPPRWTDIRPDGTDYTDGWDSHDLFLASAKVNVQETLTQQIALSMQQIWQNVTNIKNAMNQMEDSLEALAEGSSNMHDAMRGIKSAIGSIDSLLSSLFGALSPKANFTSIIQAIVSIGLYSQLLVWLKALLDELEELEMAVNYAYSVTEDVTNNMKTFTSRLGV